MSFTLLAPRKRAGVKFKSFALNGIFIAGMLVVASPVLANGGGNPDPGNNNEGCGGGAGGIEDPDGGDGVGQNLPPGCAPAVPAPLAAAGIPALALLGGGFLAVRKRRRDSEAKK